MPDWAAQGTGPSRKGGISTLFQTQTHTIFPEFFLHPRQESMGYRYGTGREKANPWGIFFYRAYLASDGLKLTT